MSKDTDKLARAAARAINLRTAIIIGAGALAFLAAVLGG